MSPRNAIIFTVLLAILLPYYYFVDRPELRFKALAAISQQESLLDLPGGIDTLTITRGDEKVGYARRADGQYNVVAPAGKFVPQDLMKALTDLIEGAKSVEVVSTNPNDLAEFGLDHPKGELTIEAGKKPPINIYFGNENPTRTAVYARIEGVPKVFLLGANLEYYQTLMFQWVEGKQGKGA
jgi:uncharacterized protein DUF4340